MPIIHYATLWLKHWKFILACFIVVGVGAYVGSKLMTPLYQSSAIIEVAIRSSVSNQADYNSLLASDQLVQTEAQIAVSYEVLHDVVSQPKFKGLTIDQLAKQVTASVKTNTQLFEIDVLDPSPTRAANLANAIAQAVKNNQARQDLASNSVAQESILEDLDATSQQINKIASQIATLQAQGAKETQFVGLQQQESELQQHYTQWQTLLAQLKLAQAQNENTLVVVQAAQPGLKPVQPITLLNTAVGFATGLLLGLLFTVLFELLDTRVRTAEALNQMTDWSVLATIFRAASSKREDILNPSGQNSNSEAYRILRTNIGFSGIDKQLRSLLITSAIPREGKSTVAANLAIFLAKAGRNTLLIDADLHRPSQHTLFDLPADSMGLSNAILEFGMSSSASVSASQASSTSVSTGITLETFVHTVSIPHLWVMPSGPLPPNPSEMLDSKSMLSLLKVISNTKFDIVILDGPPSLGLSDASILASKVDGTLIVADISRARRGNIRQLKKVMMQTGTNILGCVVNMQRHTRSDSNYYYYYRSDSRLNTDNQHSNGQDNQRSDSLNADNQLIQVLQNPGNQRSNDQYSQHSNGHPNANNNQAQVWQIDGNHHLKNENFRAVSLTPLSPVQSEPFEENGQSD